MLVKPADAEDLPSGQKRTSQSTLRHAEGSLEIRAPSIVTLARAARRKRGAQSQLRERPMTRNRVDHAALERSRSNAENEIDSKEMERAPSEKPVSTFLASRAPVAVALGLTTALAATNALGAGPTVYVFTVTCPDKSQIVEQWTIDGEDPGKEVMRGKTIDKHQGCTAADYKPATDAKLLKNTQFFSTKPPKENSWIPSFGNPFSGLWR